MKIKKSDLLNMIQEQNDVIAKLIRQVNCHHKDIIRLESVIEPEPQLKQLDQSVFDGLDEKWRFAMVSSVGIPFVYDYKPTGMRVRFSDDATQQKIKAGKVMRIDEYDYDTTDWKNSLIERDDIAKKLAEVDLSSELTGSELCKAMLERGDKFVLCAVSDESEEFESGTHDVICGVDEDGLFESYSAYWWYVKPINNQGKPLTASEVGL